jgi:hypothetical protein
VRIYPEDSLFSKYIRVRDKWKCKRCGRQYPNGDGRLQNSHFWSRNNWATRFDEENCDALCYGCHSLWENDKQGDYRDWKIKQLGREKYDKLEWRARMMYAKKDHKLALIYVRGLIKERGFNIE